MTPSFNLLDEKWIPCVKAGGQSQVLNLKDVFVFARDFADLAGDSPLVTTALYRFLLAILHRVYQGPSSHAAWNEIWSARKFDVEKITGYLETWRERFYLFHDTHPFYQSETAKGQLKPISKLLQVHGNASGNNALLFDHHPDDFSEADLPTCARALIAAQSFGFAGLSGIKGKEEKFTDASCTRGALFLAQGNNLFETLVLNLIRYDGELPIRQRREDRPCWEMEDPFAVRTFPNGYVDYLTWQSRRIKLILANPASSNLARVREMRMSQCLPIHTSLMQGDPMKRYRKDEERGWLVLRFNESRALWRDSVALFTLKEEGKNKPPAVMSWLAQLTFSRGYLERSQTLQYLALGMASEPGQDKIYFHRAERMPLPLAYLGDDNALNTLRNALQVAEQVGDVRESALSRAGYRIAIEQLLPKRKPDHRLSDNEKTGVQNLKSDLALERRYWAQMELAFVYTFERIPSNPSDALQEWKTQIKSTAQNVFDQATRGLGTSARTLRAVSLARQQLQEELKRV